jgi:hypothetical protein
MNETSFDQLQNFKRIDKNTHYISQSLAELRTDNNKNQQEILKAIQQHHWQGSNPNHVAEFSVKVTQMVEQERISLLRERFLHRLSFPRMSDRQDEIVPAHKATFDWIYEPTMGQSWGNFMDWLRHGKGVYWATGKAGSGKSTLMKYVYNNPNSRLPLQLWAGNLPLITASYYFWNSGTSMQKSQNGLLQSLLYESLVQFEDLIPQIFPYRWRSYDFFGDDLHPWSRTELMQGFDRLLKQDGVSAKFCFFVDGLDEYDGDHTEVVNLFRGVASSSSVKVFLSSRPLLVFEDAFGKCPRLMLQDLTQNDIKVYIDSQLGKSGRFLELKKREPERAPQLVIEIVDKSAGVFLWVTLVVKSLLEGLQNSDRISDLQRRLRVLPADLEDLYLLMMKNVEKFYQQQASHLFRIVHRARLPLTVLGLSFADEEDPEYAIKARVQPLDKTGVSFRYDETVRRLNSRCKGLLEVRSPRGKGRLVDSKVDFLHRTVKDFLDTPNIWESIISQSDPNFNPDISLMQSYLVQLKVMPSADWKIATFGLLEGEFMEHAVQAETTSGQVQSSLMESFCETAAKLEKKWALKHKGSKHQSEGPYCWIKNVPRVHDFPFDPQLSFLLLAVNYGMDLFVAWKLEQDNSPINRKLGRPLLDYAVVPKPHDIWGSRPRNTKLVALLLDHGADPNQRFEHQTTWKNLLHYAYEFLRPLKVGEQQELLLPVLEVMRLLVAAGANPETCCPWEGTKVPAVKVIDETFGRKLPEQSFEVKQLIKRKLEEKVGLQRAMEIEKRWYQTPQESRKAPSRPEQGRNAMEKTVEEIGEGEIIEQLPDTVDEIPAGEGIPKKSKRKLVDFKLFRFWTSQSSKSEGKLEEVSSRLQS